MRAYRDARDGKGLIQVMKRHKRKIWRGRFGILTAAGIICLQALLGGMCLTVQAEPGFVLPLSGAENTPLPSEAGEGNTAAGEQQESGAPGSASEPGYMPLPSENDEESAAGEQQKAAADALAELAADRDIMGVVYLCQEYDLKVQPQEETETSGTVSCGQTVNVLYAAQDEFGRLWLKVRVQDGAGNAEGWMEREFLACSDERFLNWEAASGMSQAAIALMDLDPGTAVPADIQQFPESYREPLIALKNAHPNWVFVPMATNLDWNASVTAELQGGKSLVYKSFADCTKEGAYDQGNWFYASREVLARYMDPRNSLTEDTIFQFEQLTYNASYHTQEALAAFLEKTFMNSSVIAPGTSMHYDLIIWALGREANVSPFHMASRIYQEQGQGTSPLISGTYVAPDGTSYVGYYNYFNIGATGTTNQQVIENGLKYAKSHNWYSAYFSIEGGAKFLAGNYISRGQDTLYLQKYNVNPNSGSTVYTHQYMQNISAPTTEAQSIRNLYRSADALNSPFVFKIPVYNNMPATPCAMPAVSTNIVLQIPSGYTGTKVFVDGVEYEAEKRNGRLIVTLPDGNAKKASIPIKDAQGKVTEICNWDLSYTGQCYKAVQWAMTIAPTDICLSRPEGYTDTTIWVDGVPCSGTVYQGQLIARAPDTNGKTAVMYRYDASGVPVDMYVWSLAYREAGYQAAAQPGLQGLLSYHGFSIRITGKSGIRFKSGISAETREKLLGEGVDGYHLKEYGTLVMTDANRKTYPMVKDGEKVKAGISYGRQGDGTVTDTIYETVSGRYRFTSVLVGLPPEQYKTEFAFRGYAVLEKDGREIVVYGPAVARSIYSLSQQALGLGLYQEGSAADQFLKKLISDADALGK